MKRFFKDVSCSEERDGWAILLDRRPVKTPAKSKLIVPKEDLALAICREWEGQKEKIDPATMPLTCYANTAMDRVLPNQAKIAEEITAYAGTDLLCYRAEEPEALVAMQTEAWDPLLDWAEETFGIPFQKTAGIAPVEQSEALMEAVSERISNMSPFILAGFYEMVSLSGSLILALAVVEGELKPETAWEKAHVDETFQETHWGRDEEATARYEARLQAFRDACCFVELLKK